MKIQRRQDALRLQDIWTPCDSLTRTHACVLCTDLSGINSHTTVLRTQGKKHKSQRFPTRFGNPYSIKYGCVAQHVLGCVHRVIVNCVHYTSNTECYTEYYTECTDGRTSFQTGTIFAAKVGERSNRIGFLSGQKRANRSDLHRFSVNTTRRSKSPDRIRYARENSMS